MDILQKTYAEKIGLGKSSGSQCWSQDAGPGVVARTGGGRSTTYKDVHGRRVCSKSFPPPSALSSSARGAFLVFLFLPLTSSHGMNDKLLWSDIRHSSLSIYSSTVMFVALHKQTTDTLLVRRGERIQVKPHQKDCFQKKVKPENKATVLIPFLYNAACF